MANPFKKYELGIAADRKRRANDPILKLKQSLVQSNKDFVQEELDQVDPANFRSLQEYEAAGGSPTAAALDYYSDLNARLDQISYDQHLEDRRLREKDAWVSDAGLETATGTTINAIAKSGKTVNRWLQHAATAPDTAAIEGNLQGIPQDILELWADKKVNGGEFTEEENALLEGKTEGPGFAASFLHKLANDPLNLVTNAVKATGETVADNAMSNLSYRERLENVDRSMERADNIAHAFENSSIVKNYNPISEQQLFEDFGESYKRHEHHFDNVNRDVNEGNYDDAVVDTMLGVGNLIKDGGKDLLNNPGATFEFIVEQAPYLVAGAYSKKILGAVNGTYGVDIYRQKLKRFQEENGRHATDEERVPMAVWSGTASVAELAGNLAMMKALKRGLEKTPGYNTAVRKILETTPDKVQKVANNTLTRNAAGIAKTAGQEGITETYQTAVETSEVSPFDGTADGEEVFAGGMIGAAAGGGFGAIGSPASIMRDMAAAEKTRASRANHELTGRYAQEIAAGIRPAEDLLNEDDPRLYHPGRATAALTARANDKELSEEQRTEASTKVNEIFDGLNQRAVELREKLENEPNKTKRKKISRDLKDTEGFLELATRGIDNVNAALKMQREAAADQQQDLKTATQDEVTPESQEAAERVIHSMAFNSELYGHDTESSYKILDELRNSPSVTEEQKQYIDGIEASYKAEDALSNATKNAKGVNRDIRNGAPGFKGVLQYRRDTNRALRKGNLDKAETEIETLREFARDHSKKFKQAKLALDKALESGEDVYLFRNPKSDTGWEIRTKSEGSPPWNTRTQQSQVGGFTFNMRGKGARKAAQDFVNVLESEVGLINSMGKELVQAKKLASTGNTKTTTQDSTESGFDESVIPETIAPPAANAGNINVNTGEETASSPGPADAVPGTRQESQGSPDTANDVRPEQETEAEVALEDESYDSLIAELEAQANNETETESETSSQELDNAGSQSINQGTGTTVAGRSAQKSWREATRVRSDSGPQRIFRGASRPLAPDHFDSNNLGKNTGHPSSGLGVWFTENPGEAGRHGKVEEFYVDLRNPAVFDAETFPEFDSLEEAQQAAKTLQDQGYDGIIYDTTDLGGEIQVVAFTPDSVITADSVDTSTTPQTDTTAEAQAAPAAQEPAAVVEEETTQETETEARPATESGEASQYFTQREASDSDATSNPLVQFEDFISLLEDAGEDLRALIQPFLDKDLTDKQVELIQEFITFMNLVDSKLVEQSSKERNPDWMHEDLAKLFGQPMPQNMRTAIAAAAFTHLIENGGKTMNSNAEINAILGRDSKASVGAKEGKHLRPPYDLQNHTSRQLGKRVVRFLNIQAKKGAPADKIKNLEASLGNYALSVLLENGYARKNEFKRDEVSDPEYKGPKKAEPEIDQQVDTNVDPDYNTIKTILIDTNSSHVKGLVALSRESGNVLGDIFGIEKGTVYPSSKPGSFNAKKAIAKGVPAILAKILQRVSKRPQKLNNEVGGKLLQFSEKVRLRMAGVETREDRYIHDGLWDSIQAKNNGIIRDLKDWQGFREHNGDEVFYLNPVVYSQQRVGLSHRVMNPQSSKVYRHLMYPKKWETEVDPNKSSRKLIYFKAAVAQGMGFSVDKKNLQASVDFFDQLMQDPEILAALEALSKDEMTEADEATVAKAVEKGGENLWSFHMLVEMAKYQQGESFTTNVMLEIDGVTNGPALSQMMLGTVGPWLGSKMGFMTTDMVNQNNLNNHTEFKERGGRDLYETLAHLIQKYLNHEYIETTDGPVLKDGVISRMTQDVLFFTGSFSDTDGRKRAKTPITMMSFGSSESKSVSNMAREMITLYYEQIEEASRNDNQLELDEIKERINRLIPNSNLKVADLSKALSPQQETAIMDSFFEVLKPAVDSALKEQFGAMMKRREKLYLASKAMYEMFMIAHKHYYQEALNNSPNVRWRNGKPIDDITAEEYAEIDRKLGKIMPQMHSALSKLTDASDRSAGIMLPKTRFTSADRESAYQQRSQFLRPVQNNFRRDGSLSKYIRTQAESLSWEEPRVRAMVMGIHSSDSAIASLTYRDFDALNIHDALGFALDDVLEGGRALNQNTFRILADYSPAVELERALNESFDAMKDLVAANPELKKEANSINAGPKWNPQLFTPSMLADISKTAWQAELDKLNYMLNLEKISQYSFDGTEYNVTDRDREIIQLKIDAAKQKLRDLGVNNPQPEYQEKRTDIDNTANKTPWGMTGMPNKLSDQSLVQLFLEKDGAQRRSKPVTARKLARELENRIKQTGRSHSIKAFEIGLLRTAMKLINPNMEIRLIRPDTPPIKGVENLQQSVGFYHPDGWIGIKSPEFQDSMITTEMLLHELLHAATSSVMHRIRTGEETDPVAIEAYKGLENLLTKAKAFVQKEGLSEFDNAVSNVDELVSWGLTSQDFQDKVLAKIQITPEEEAGLTNRVERSGFKEFIGKIFRLIFRDKGPRQWRSGLGSLVADASILMKSKAPRTKTNSEGQPIRSMAFEQESAFSFSPQEVFDGLHKENDSLDPERTRRLKAILTSVVEAVFQDGAYKEKVERSVPVTPEELYIEALTNDTRMFRSDLAQHMKLNDQEQYVLESVELALRETLKLNNMIRQEADIMFTEMKKKGPSILVRGDWNQLGKKQQEMYQNIFNGIFKISRDSNQRAAYLSKFLAAAMVYQPLGEAMSQTYIPKGRPSLRGLNFLERAQKIMQWFYSFLRRHVAKTRQGDDYAESTKRMIINMVRLENDRKTKLEKARKRGETGLESKLNKAADKVRSGASTVSQSRLFRNSKFTLVRFSSKAAQMTSEDRVGDFMDNLKRLRDGATNERLGLMGQSWIELRGDDDINAMLTQMLSQTKTIEQMRKRLNIEVHENVDEAFESLSDDESEALTKTLVRSGAFILMDNHSMNDILELVADQRTRRKRIKTLVSQLPKKHRHYYETQARNLGLHLAEGGGHGPMLMRNAHNIAHYLGINDSMPVDPDVAAQAEPVIDEIATLVAIDTQTKSTSSPRNYRDLTAEVMRRELNRKATKDNPNKTNGIEFLLRMHREMDKESRKSLFGDDKTQIVKGYTKDTYDPYIDVVVVKASKENQELMRKAGYKKVEHEILQDSADPRKEKLEMYTARNGGVGQHITGMFSNTDQHRQGTTLVGARRDAQGRINQKNATLLQQIAHNKTDDVLAMIKGNYKASPNNSLVPVLDTKGNIISWRYMMSEATRDDILRRDNRVGKVMGNIASSIVDKSQTPLLNKNAVDAVKAIYEQNFVDNSDAFIEFGPQSSDPEIQERYRLLPETTKQYIREVWGRDGMMIRNDTYNILFGYRKASLKQVLEMPAEQRGMVKATIVKLLGEYELVDENGHTVKKISSRRGKYFMQAENAWEEIVAMVKDFWVIKSFSTLVGNETSNATILYLNGVPPWKIPHLKLAAYQQTKDYIRHRKERERLERLIALGHLSNDQLDTAQQEILHLQALMEASPVAELMDQGMYQTLVEDVSQDEDQYSYKSQLSDKIGSMTQWVPKIARDTVKVGLMTHDTQLYKFLNDLTIMSDFTSRVVLNEHLKNRPTKQLSDTERQRRVRDAFIDYDVPTSKAMQKLNDTGVVWFSKYYLRIQHVILQLVRENPVRALQLWAIADWVWSLPDILDSTLLQKDLGNSFGVGAFEMLDAPRELITYKVTDDVFFD